MGEFYPSHTESDASTDRAVLSFRRVSGQASTTLIRVLPRVFCSDGRGWGRVGDHPDTIREMGPSGIVNLAAITASMSRKVGRQRQRLSNNRRLTRLLLRCRHENWHAMPPGQIADEVHLAVPIGLASWNIVLAYSGSISTLGSRHHMQRRKW
jgi:hypothetical protein